jgi:CheY-like chemotaxis protein
MSGSASKSAPVKEKVVIHLDESDFKMSQGKKPASIGGKQIFQVFVVMLAGLAVGLGCLNGSALDWLSNVFTKPPETSAVRPLVLVVSPDTQDQLGVSGAAEPRGYATVVASNADDGVRTVNAGPGEIRVVVIDSRLPGASKVSRAVKKSLPTARVIMLKSRRQPEELAQILLEAF